MVEAVWSEAAVPVVPTTPTLNLVSPSVGRRSKGHRGITGELHTFLFIYLKNRRKKKFFHRFSKIAKIFVGKDQSVLFYFS